MSKIDTSKWAIGYYPMPPAPPKTDRELVEELHQFNHHDAAQALAKSVGICEEPER